ncbi:BapA/Bap/LapF family prefix-like domain-containing protein, partial [Nitratireductor sp.]|uniref:BapA/Bap/LapF family prefix-like domain-containing protein n=1 Tax=Nitratireductor sp. TaxID=1872084 RepID=UPI0025E4DF30
MAAVISVKGTGSERTAALDAIALDAPSVVTLKIPPSAVESFTRDGNHLLLKLHDGRVVRIENFYIESDGAKSDLVLEDPSGDLWFGDHTAGLADFQFSEIASVDHLIGGGVSGSSLMGLAGLGLLAGGAAALSGGGSNADDGDADADADA